MIGEVASACELRSVNGAHTGGFIPRSVATIPPEPASIPAGNPRLVVSAVRVLREVEEPAIVTGRRVPPASETAPGRLRELAHMSAHARARGMGRAAIIRWWAELR